jgi:transposase
VDAITYVGLDTHLKNTVIAVARGRDKAEVVATVRSDPFSIGRKLGELGPAPQLRVCYEAGPNGYGLQRWLSDHGVQCEVIAPSLTPRVAGNRIKTDYRDACHLAESLRSNTLTPILVPTPELEAARGLSRERQAAIEDRHRVRQRLIKLLQRHQVVEPPGSRWTKRWITAMQQVRLDEPAARRTVESLWSALAFHDQRVADLTSTVEWFAQSASFGATWKAVQVLHGVGPIVAFGIIAELGDLRRFSSPPKLFAYVGLIPSEHSSGGRQQRGGITRTGNRHVRWLLTEAAWHMAGSVSPPRTPPETDLERLNQRARIRLHNRFCHLLFKGKSRQQAITAVARELLGYIWEIGQMVPIPAPSATPVAA